MLCLMAMSDDVNLDELRLINDDKYCVLQDKRYKNVIINQIVGLFAFLSSNGGS